MTTTDPLDDILADFSVARDYPALMYEESKNEALAKLNQYIEEEVKKAEKEWLKETNGIAGALGRFAERVSKKPHKHWYIGVDKKGNAVMHAEEKGLALQSAIATTVHSVELMSLVKLRDGKGKGLNERLDKRIAELKEQKNG